MHPLTIILPIVFVLLACWLVWTSQTAQDALHTARVNRAAKRRRLRLLDARALRAQLIITTIANTRLPLN